MVLTKRSPRVTVIKVGGSLLASGHELNRVAQAAAERRNEESILVVGSALRGVTDQLELATIQSLDLQRKNGHLSTTLEELRQRHLKLAREVEGTAVIHRVQEILDQVEALVGTVRATGDLSAATYARLLCAGERLSVTLLAAAIEATGHAAQAVTAEEAGVRAAGAAPFGSVDVSASAQGFRQMRHQLSDRILVLTGFYGIGREGGVVLFGRGGSDNTAGAAAACLGADRLELWKDVPGFMSADPREVHDARLIDEISFDEAAQLGAYGSRIVNHGCIELLRGCPAQVLVSSLEGARSGLGTLVVEGRRPDAARVVALGSRKGYAEIQLEGSPGMGLRQEAGRALNALMDAEIPCQPLTVNEISARFSITEADVDRAQQVICESARGCAVSVRHSPALVGAVGEGVASDPEIRARMLSCLAAAGARGDLVIQPSGQSGLSCSVHSHDLGPSLLGLHEVFFAAPEASPKAARALAARSAAPARKLVTYWDEARLHVAHAKSTSVRPAPGRVPWRAALEDVLKVGYGVQTQTRFVAGAWELIRWRTTPSAGALYPYEVLATVVGEASYLWDIEQARLVPSDLPPLTRDDLASAGFLTNPGQHLEAVLVFLARPWLSMKKYQRRGYAYCHLDVGHLAANLAIYTSALGHTPTLHLRFSRSVLTDHLRLHGLCREPLASLSFTSNAAPIAAQEPAAVSATTSLEVPDAREIGNWESLGGLISLNFELEPPCAPACSTLLREPEGVDERAFLPLADGDSQPSSPKDWRSAILARRSAKGFLDEPLKVAQVSALLGSLRSADLPADCFSSGFPRLGVRLIARNVDGLSGVFAYASDRHALVQISEQAGDPRPACMQQEIAGNVAALLIFHAPVFHLLAEQGYSAFTELHFHAAQLGQRLHLSAARIGILGMTCIGGFDGEECASLARLDAEDEPVYVVLLGIPDESAFKGDRLRVAYSHGYTTVEG